MVKWGGNSVSDAALDLTEGLCLLWPYLVEIGEVFELISVYKDKNESQLCFYKSF